jgi:putative glycosyl hydrolase
VKRRPSYGWPVALAVIVLSLLAAAVPPAAAAPGLHVGVVDHALALGKPEQLGPSLRALGAQVVRVNLYWGGKFRVPRTKPIDGTDPADRAYDWRPYDRIVLEAEGAKAEVAFTIFGTPAWANNGRAPNRPPRDPERLEDFAYAAATRYSGSYEREDGTVLPRVRFWIAWNEPNIPLGLVPQWRRVGRRWVIESAHAYAEICNAIYEGVHFTLLTGQKVACGVTAPRGNNAPRLKRPSVDPLAFLRAMKRAGARTFDAYAHQPYYGSRFEGPSTRPRGRHSITLGNIDRLVREVTRLYGRKRIWITEYGYETGPPDFTFGVSWARQARYLRQAFAIARRHPRIDLMLWFLVKDEYRLHGWQSGLVSGAGKRKPSFAAFRQVSRRARAEVAALTVGAG